MIRKKILPFALIIGLAAVLGVGARRFRIQASNTQQPMTLRCHIYEGSQLVGEQTFSIFSNGDHRIQILKNGSVYAFLRLRGQGFYVIDDTRQTVRQDLRVNTDVPMLVASAEQLRQSPKYVKDDVIMGIPAIMHRQMNPETGKAAIETWFAPAVAAWAPLRVVSYDQNTGAVTSRVEPISIDFTEPSSELLRIPNYVRIQ